MTWAMACVLLTAATAPGQTVPSFELQRPYAGFTATVAPPWRPMTTSPDDDYMLLLSRIVQSRITMILSVSVYTGPGLTLERFAAAQKALDGRDGRARLVDFSQRQRRVGDKVLDTVRSLVTSPGNPAFRYYREFIVDGRVLYLVELEHREADAALAERDLDAFVTHLALAPPRNCNDEVHPPDSRVSIKGGDFTFMYPSTFQREQEDVGALFVAKQWNPESTLMLPALRLEHVAAGPPGDLQTLIEGRVHGWVQGRRQLGEDADVVSIEPFTAAGLSGRVAMLKTAYTHQQLKRKISKTIALAMFVAREDVYALEVTYESEDPTHARDLIARMLGNIVVQPAE